MTQQPMLNNPLVAGFSAADFDRVVGYWCGSLLRHEFRALLDRLQMTAKQKGEPFEWREQKGWFKSSFTVRAVPDRHAAIQLWAERHAVWDAH